MANTYKVKQSDPGNALFEGQTVKPDYEDANEIIIASNLQGTMHHVKKSGAYFAEHFEIAGGK